MEGAYDITLLNWKVLFRAFTSFVRPSIVQASTTLVPHTHPNTHDF